MKIHTELMQGNCIQLLQNIKDESIDAVITDPPYCYLNTKEKNCEFDKSFDNLVFVEQCKRVLKKTGFVVMFGRGENFYKLNTLFCDAKFKFKEDIVWNKASSSSPFHQIGRVHENIVIFTKNNGIIRKTKIPYLESINAGDIKNKKDTKEVLFQISDRIRHIYNALDKPKELHQLKEFLDGNVIYSKPTNKNVLNVTRQTLFYKPTLATSILQSLTKGKKEEDIINIPTIIKEAKLINNYHPTEKPIRLIERLISLVTDEGDVVLDPFTGSGTTGVACIKQKRHFIGMELDEKYFDVAYRRIEDEKRETKETLFDILDDETMQELQSAMQEEENKKDDDNSSSQFNFPNGCMSQDEINEILKDMESCNEIIKKQQKENENKSIEEVIKELNEEYDKITI